MEYFYIKLISFGSGSVPSYMHTILGMYLEIYMFCLLSVHSVGKLTAVRLISNKHRFVRINKANASRTLSQSRKHRHFNSSGAAGNKLSSTQLIRAGKCSD